jgi:hypothetical protein
MLLFQLYLLKPIPVALTCNLHPSINLMMGLTVLSLLQLSLLLMLGLLTLRDYYPDHGLSNQLTKESERWGSASQPPASLSSSGHVQIHSRVLLYHSLSWVIVGHGTSRGARFITVYRVLLFASFCFFHLFFQHTPVVQYLGRNINVPL